MNGHKHEHDCMCSGPITNIHLLLQSSMTLSRQLHKTESKKEEMKIWGWEGLIWGLKLWNWEIYLNVYKYPNVERKDGAHTLKEQKKREEQKKEAWKEERRGGAPRQRSISNDPLAYRCRAWSALNVTRPRTTTIKSQPQWKKPKKSPC